VALADADLLSRHFRSDEAAGRRASAYDAVQLAGALTRRDLDCCVLRAAARRTVRTVSPGVAFWISLSSHTVVVGTSTPLASLQPADHEVDGRSNDLGSAGKHRRRELGHALALDSSIG